MNKILNRRINPSITIYCQKVKQIPFFLPSYIIYTFLRKSYLTKNDKKYIYAKKRESFMKCPKCNKAKFVKNGSKGEEQRYKCKLCKCQFTKNHKVRHPIEDKRVAVLLQKLGFSTKELTEIFKISNATLFRWLKDSNNFKSANKISSEMSVIDLKEKLDMIKLGEVGEGEHNFLLTCNQAKKQLKIGQIIPLR